MSRFLLCVSVSIFLLASCAAPEKEILKAKAGRVYGGHVAYYAVEKTANLFPASIVSIYDQRNVAPVFECLLSYAEEGQKMLPNLVESYTFSSDNNYLDLNIKQGVQFHEDSCYQGLSRVLSASDIKFTLDFACSSHPLNNQEQLLTPKIMGAEAFYSAKEPDFDKGVAGITILSDTSLRIRLVDSTRTILKILTHQSLSVVSKRAYEFYGDNIINHPIGTGPFIFQKNSANSLLFTRNSDYWKKDKYKNRLPFIDSLTIKFTKESEDIFKSFTSQKTDLLSSIPINEINSLFGTLTDAQEGKNILHKFQHKKGRKVNFLEFDCTKPPFDDVNLRKSMYHAIDRQKICNDYLFGEGAPAIQGILPSVPFFSYMMPVVNPYNMRLAKSCLRKSNYEKGDTISFYVNVEKGSSEDQWCKSIVGHFQKELKLQMKLVYVSFTEKMDAIQSGKASLWKATIISDYPDAESFLMPYYSKNRGIFKTSKQHFSSLEYDNKMDQARKEASPVRRNLYFNECVQILNKEAAIVPLYFEDLVVVFNLRLRGAKVNSLGILDLSGAFLKPIP